MSEQQANIDQENVDRILAAADGASVLEMIQALLKKLETDSEPYRQGTAADVTYHPEWNFGVAMHAGMRLLLGAITMLWSSMHGMPEELREKMGTIAAEAGHAHVCTTEIYRMAAVGLDTAFDRLLEMPGVEQEECAAMIMVHGNPNTIN